MRFSTALLAIAGLFTSSFALPTNTLADVSVNGVTLFRRQLQCNVDYCTTLFQGCIHSCASLDNGDCFDAFTSPSCEGCKINVLGCGDESVKC